MTTKNPGHEDFIRQPPGLETLVRWRRDVRRFKRDAVSGELLQQILRVADLAPSVGNSQPWRVVRVTAPEARAKVRDNFLAANARAASIYTGEEARKYRDLKLAGFDAAPEHIAVFCDPDSSQGHGLGRQTMPETLDHSCVCMITILWLAAREQGLGLGWVSILDPKVVSEIFGVPASWKLIGYLLLGYPEEEHLDPELERFGWQSRTPKEVRFSEKSSAKTGRVILAGAGPGDPELLTVRAVRELETAEAVLYDDLVAKPILDLINPAAQKIDVGKRGYRTSCKQPEINARLIALAKQGLRVVRLKGGDPLIFGRAGEEIAACRAAGIPVEVVPGVTSAQGAAARLAIPLTNRDHARRLQFITAHDRHGKLPADIDWSAIADGTATTVIYMPKRTLAELSDVAIRHGLDPATPAYAIANATREDEKVLRSTIGEIAHVLHDAHFGGPVLVLVGEALRADEFSPAVVSSADAV